MLLAAVILLAVLVALAAATLAVVVAPHLHAHRGHRVVVNLRSGESLTGRLVRRGGVRVELAEARLHEAGEVNVLDGVAVVEKSNVTFMQVLPPIDPDQRA